MIDRAETSRLPDISGYSPARRRDYLILVAAVAASDNQLHPDELELLEGWMRHFDLPARYRREVLAAAHREGGDLAKIQRRLSKTNLKYSLLLDMMGMAMADGVLMDDERAVLQEVADALGLDTIDFNIMMDFVHAAHQASSLACPEPLYEYNISSAFELFRDRDVQLFPHTLLCVGSPAFDLELKSRWFEFITSEPTKGN